MGGYPKSKPTKRKLKVTTKPGEIEVWLARLAVKLQSTVTQGVTRQKKKKAAGHHDQVARSGDMPLGCPSVPQRGQVGKKLGNLVFPRF